MGASIVERVAVLVYMASVTSFVLALLFASAAAGALTGGELFVYALAAGFGLEFVLSAWPTLWRREPPAEGQPGR